MSDKFAQELLDAYFIDWKNHSTDDNHAHIQKMASILSLYDGFSIKSFVELRSKYIGTNTKIDLSANNHHLNEDVILNYSLFHAALLTNSPTIIDDIMQYIPFDFNTLNIPHDQIDIIKQSNAVHNHYEDDIYPNNYILVAIVNAIKKGHHESILHLINNYHLSPIIPICDCLLYQKVGCTNLLYYASSTTNTNFIQYLLPLCFPSTSTNTKLISSIFCELAEHGHLDAIQTLYNTYNVSPHDFTDEKGNNILYYAAKSNIELIDYLIEVVGFDPNDTCLLYSSILALKWDNLKHFSTKYQIKMEQNYHKLLLQHAGRDLTITSDALDDLITMFNITLDDINGIPMNSELSPLFYFVESGNITLFKHLIEKYQANPFCDLPNGGYSLLHHILRSKSFPSIEMIEYLCTLGLDVNKKSLVNQSPLEHVIYARYEGSSSIIQILLKHGADIVNISEFIFQALSYHQFDVAQYLLQRYHTDIDFTYLTQTVQVFHVIAKRRSPIEFFTYILSLNKIDINQLDRLGYTIIHYAIHNANFNLDFIKLLINNGANVAFHDWLSMFEKQLPAYNPASFFTCLDFFKNQYGWDIATFTSQNLESNDDCLGPESPLLLFLKKLTFRYSTISCNIDAFRNFVICRSFFSRYGANINECNNTTSNNALHYLANNNQIELIQFVLSNSLHKSNIYHINNKSETFLHLLMSSRFGHPTMSQEMSRSAILTQVDDVKSYSFSTSDDTYAEAVNNNLANLIDTIIDHL